MTAWVFDDIKVCVCVLAEPKNRGSLLSQWIKGSTEELWWTENKYSSSVRAKMRHVSQMLTLLRSEILVLCLFVNHCWFTLCRMQKIWSCCYGTWTGNHTAFLAPREWETITPVKESSLLIGWNRGRVKAQSAPPRRQCHTVSLEPNKNAQ